MTDEKTRALIAALRANVNEAARGTPPTMAAKILAGESDDDRLALMVQAADALDAFSTLTVPDGDAREVREIAIEGVKIDARGRMRHDSRVWYEALESALDALLPAFWGKATASALGRDIAGEIEAEIERVKSDNPRVDAKDSWWSGYLNGLRRAAEIVRSGR